MNIKKPIVAFLFATAALTTVAACDSNDGPMEEAGEELDDAADEVEDATN